MIGSPKLAILSPVDPHPVWRFLDDNAGLLGAQSHCFKKEIAMARLTQLLYWAVGIATIYSGNLRFSPALKGMEARAQGKTIKE